jgi:hypothetical protein
MSVGARLAQAVEASGESLRSFAARAGVPYRTLQNYVGGVRAPQSDVLAPICTRTGVSGHWLLTGEGEMYRERPVAGLGVREPAPLAGAGAGGGGGGAGAAAGEWTSARAPPGAAAPTGVAEPSVPGGYLRGQTRARLAFAAVLREGGDDPAPGPVPEALSPRLAALAAILAQITPEAREQILAEAFARATTAQQLADLRQALAEMQDECRRAG